MTLGWRHLAPVQQIPSASPAFASGSFSREEHGIHLVQQNASLTLGCRDAWIGCRRRCNLIQAALQLVTRFLCRLKDGQELTWCRTEKNELATSIMGDQGAWPEMLDAQAYTLAVLRF